MPPLDSSTEEAFFNLHMEFETFQFDGYLRHGGSWLSLERRSFVDVTVLISGRSQQGGRGYRAWFGIQLLYLPALLDEKSIHFIHQRKGIVVGGTEAIAGRIKGFGAGRAFTAADFSDVAGRRNAANALGRMYAKGVLARAVRGVYYVPERSVLMGCEVPVSADEVVRAIARASKWIVAPSGDAALNALGLDTQVPAKLVYVSSGPYKRYEYGFYEIELKHRANRDLLNCSQGTCTIVQALKALGRENVGNGEIEALARNLTERQVDEFLQESMGLTSWVTEAAGRIRETKHRQDC